MPRPTKHHPERGSARARLLEAALRVIREKGYSASTVDDLCAAAEVTKGAFFHHFDGKEALAVAAAEHWSETTGALFADAPYHAHDDPLERVLAYIEFRKAILTGDVSEFTCLVGTMVQEAYDRSPRIREACAASIFGHAATLESDIASAMSARGLAADWTAESLACHTQAVLQGAFVLAKAKGDASVAIESVEHLQRYVSLLFQKAGRRKESTMNYVDGVVLAAPFMTMNGNPEVTSSHTTSISVLTKDQSETDQIWNAFLSHGGEEGQCGWLKDRFGVHWQIVPEALPRLMHGGDPEAAARVSAALMNMRKIDVAALEAAAANVA